MNIFLYIATLISWGCSWLAIKWQGGLVPVPNSIFYRFALAAIILMAIMILFKRLQAANRRDHIFFMLQGGTLFSLNFIAFYTATNYIASGLVAVIMSTAILFNAFHNKLFWSVLPRSSFKLGAPVGLVGLVLLFWSDLISSNWATDTLTGIGFAFLGTWIFSLGNMVSVRHTRKGITPATSNAWGMIYGCIILLFIILNSGDSWVWDSEPRYLMALLYLSIIASIIGFSTYLMLVARIGANSAATLW